MVMAAWQLLVVCALVLVPKALAVTNPRDVDALNAFRATLLFPPALQSWVGRDPCGDRWFGVTNCTAADSHDMLQNVTGLELPGLGLTGTIDPELFNMVDLYTLDLSGNQLSGTIPPNVGQLTKVYTLSLESNKLTGPIPPSIGNCTNLYFLKVTNNQLSGSIPQTVGSLKNLWRFSIDQNQISGTIPPQLGSLAYVAHLHMDNNLLTGSIPATIGRLPNLIHLILANNRLSGDLPDELAFLPSILIMRLEYNGFTGGIPADWARLSTLQELSLKNNSLTDAVPNEIGALSSLLYLDVSFNSISGPLPSSIASLRNLYELNVQNNRLFGSIPSAMTNMVNLQTFVANDNLFTGSLPAFGGTTSSLQVLHVHNNRLSGPIPSNLRNGQNQLIDLTVYGNPWCDASSATAGATACLVPATVNLPPTVAGAPQAGVLPAQPPTSSCQCPPGQVVRPQGLGGAGSGTLLQPCACAWPMFITISLDKYPYASFTDQNRDRLMQNLARELFLQPIQVSAAGQSQNGSATVASAYLLPLTGSTLDMSAVQRVHSRLAGDPNDHALLDGDFGHYHVLAIQDPQPLAASGTAGNSSSGGGIGAGAIIGILIGVILVIVVALAAAFLWYRKRKANRYGVSGLSWVPAKSNTINYSMSQTSQGTKVQRPNYVPAPVRIFTLDELSFACNGFAKHNLLGIGGFGRVYKGVLEDGTEVAIKQLDRKSSQGESEFRTEVQIIAHHLYHPNLVQLLGYCSQGQDRLLVYELMIMNSLKDYLAEKGQPPAVLLSWDTRCLIAYDTALGLQYLHEGVEPPVVHRDIKASNILLNDKWEAKVADFGLAKLYPTAEDTHVTTRVVGTFGYLAPDYGMTGQLTTKSDVYSFGVVLLELISGRKAVDTSQPEGKEHLVPWCCKHLHEKSFLTRELVDPYLEGAYPTKGLQALAGIAAECIQQDPARRPTMTMVAEALLPVLELKAPKKKGDPVKGSSRPSSRSGSVQQGHASDSSSSFYETSSLTSGSYRRPTMRSPAESDRSTRRRSTDTYSLYDKSHNGDASIALPDYDVTYGGAGGFGPHGIDLSSTGAFSRQTSGPPAVADPSLVQALPYESPFHPVMEATGVRKAETQEDDEDLT